MCCIVQGIRKAVVCDHMFQNSKAVSQTEKNELPQAIWSCLRKLEVRSSLESEVFSKAQVSMLFIVLLCSSSYGCHHCTCGLVRNCRKVFHKIKFLSIEEWLWCVLFMFFVCLLVFFFFPRTVLLRVQIQVSTSGSSCTITCRKTFVWKIKEQWVYFQQLFWPISLIEAKQLI